MRLRKVTNPLHLPHTLLVNAQVLLSHCPSATMNGPRSTGFGATVTGAAVVSGIGVEVAVEALVGALVGTTVEGEVVGNAVGVEVGVADRALVGAAHVQIALSLLNLDWHVYLANFAWHVSWALLSCACVQIIPPCDLQCASQVGSAKSMRLRKVTNPLHLPHTLLVNAQVLLSHCPSATMNGPFGATVTGAAVVSGIGVEVAVVGAPSLL